LSAVIDFGTLSAGDSACELSIAWTLFEGESRRTLRAMLPFDSGSSARARGWTLWNASIVAAGLANARAIDAAQSLSYRRRSAPRALGLPYGPLTG
jgi:aminoglycoside phosphotransferase (APT) family kinase protein